MKVQQITPNYNHSKVNTNFKAGNIRICNPEDFLAKELEAIAKNDEFKKLAKIAGENNSDLSITGNLVNALLSFSNIRYKIDIRHYHLQKLSDVLEKFTVKDMMQKLEKQREKELKEINSRKQAFMKRFN